MNAVSFAALALVSNFAFAENVITMNGKTYRTNGTNVSAHDDGNGNMVVTERSETQSSRRSVNGKLIYDTTTVTDQNGTRTTNNLDEEEPETSAADLAKMKAAHDARQARAAQARPRAEPRDESHDEFDRDFEKHFGTSLPAGEDRDYGVAANGAKGSTYVKSCVDSVCSESRCEGTIYTMNNKVRCVPRAGSRTGSSTSTAARPAASSLGTSTGAAQ